MKMSSKLRDGNIAFKVTYNDKKWSGICSPEIYKRNVKKIKSWCRKQAPSCQENYVDDDLSDKYFPCYDSVALKWHRFSPGWKHGKEEEPFDVTILTPEKENELCDVLSASERAEHEVPIILTALHTGMRKREILDLTKDNVDFKKGLIHVIHTKNWEIRDIPMNETLTKILEEVIDKSPEDSPYVFANPKTGKPYTDIKTGFPKAVEKIGIKGFRFHDLRHTWCSRMCELGVDEATIQELGGWKTRSMINRYAHPSINHKRKALEKLDEVPPKVPPWENRDTQGKVDNNAK